MLTNKDLEKFHNAAERILKAIENSKIPVSWHEIDTMRLQGVIAKELMLMERKAKK